MPWYYFSRTGKLYHEHQFIAKGYSGNTIGLNNPDFQWLPNTGPIPPGRYQIGLPRNSATTGPFVLDLTPVDHSALGRRGFQIHGDNSLLNNTASKGCIILKKSIREKIANSGDDMLTVIGARIISV